MHWSSMAMAAALVTLFTLVVAALMDPEYPVALAVPFDASRSFFQVHSPKRTQLGPRRESRYSRISPRYVDHAPCSRDKR